jgi:LIX1-like protein
LNVIEALQEFWQKKLAVNSSSRNLQDDNMISYASEPVNYPPHVCFVTLPGGCSFGTLHQCTDRAEARRQAAHIALVNCIYNELPSRKITDKFIDDAVRETFQLDPVADESAVDAFRFVLEATRGQTMLDYIALANRLLVMHWSGALKSMSQRTVTRQEVLKCALMTPWFSEDYRSELALEWMAVERTEPGRIDRELSTAVSQLDNARQTGRELAFPRLKRDVLQLAISQLDVT